MKIVTNANIGDMIYFLHENKVVSYKVINICINANDLNISIRYDVESNSNSCKYVYDHLAFLTKEELLASL